MEKRRLGRTNLEVTTVGFGGAPIGRTDCTDEQAHQAVWAMLEAGVNLVDTSPHYGLGRSETRIGQALAARPDLTAGLVLSTKTGHYGPEKDYSYDRTLRSVEMSLGRLGVDLVDIVHIHDVQTAEELEEVVTGHAAYAALRRLRDEGVLDHIGIGTKGLDALDYCLRCDGFDVIMIANQYNLLETAGAEIIARATAQDVGVINAGTYATGILVKGVVPEARYHYRPVEDEVRARAAALVALCDAWGVALPAAAIGYCLRGPAAQAVTVLGARTPEQAAANVAHAQAAIPDGFWEALADLQETL